MTVIIIILIFSAILGGLASNFFSAQTSSIRYPLIFAGSFLFSITIIHILPEVFALSSNPMRVGLFVLGGFFFQQFLEYFTSGVEHGHAHAHHHMTGVSKFGLLSALVIHSLLEGALLTHDSPFHDQHESYSLLVGIVLHKVPAAFALMTTLKTEKGFDLRLWVILITFSIASPLGLFMSDFILELSSDNLMFLFAFVSGSFLHISTTIFVESSPNHHFGVKKFVISLSGALLAILTEFVL
ncbi:MAG: zinc permease [Cyclobacteriaceae bacterium]